MCELQKVALREKWYHIIDPFPFLHPVAWNLDLMAGALAVIKAHED